MSTATAQRRNHGLRRSVAGAVGAWHFGPLGLVATASFLSLGELPLSPCGLSEADPTSNRP